MGIAISTHLPPPVMIESTEVRRWVTHKLCWSCRMYFSAAASSEKDHGSMNLDSKHRLRALHDSVEGSHNPRDCRMPDPALHVADPPASVALIPGAIELLGR